MSFVVVLVTFLVDTEIDVKSNILKTALTIDWTHGGRMSDWTPHEIQSNLKARYKFKFVEWGKTSGFPGICYKIEKESIWHVLPSNVTLDPFRCLVGLRYFLDDYFYNERSYLAHGQWQLDDEKWEKEVNEIVKNFAKKHPKEIIFIAPNTLMWRNREKLFNRFQWINPLEMSLRPKYSRYQIKKPNKPVWWKVK